MATAAGANVAGTSRPSSWRQQHIHGGSSSSSTTSRSNTTATGGIGGQGAQGVSVRSRGASGSRRSVTPTTSRAHHSHHPSDPEPGRVRVAVRIRPRNAEDLIADADFADCVELQPELRRLKLRKNNWSFESYRFDEVFTESASQKRVYEVVAKPVVESVLNGYNGTIMAYGQTGTGKTYTLGRLVKNDASERGIMVRAMEDIFYNTSTPDSVEISYLQLYMESIQDLLAPEKVNMAIAEDPNTGEVSLPGATVIKIQNLDHLLQLLQIGEANRHAANTKLNTESSRSHAILMVYCRRYVQEKEENDISSPEQDTTTNPNGGCGIPIVRKSKMLIVDLAGSERLDKSGSEGHLVEEAKFINLSLTSLGKCINALAENSPHIPTRDSKLTRLLRDSFGGSARTSLIVTIGPSSRHHAETTSTIMFGQRAMKVVNTVKLKEEFDYESLCRKLENQVDHLTAEIDRQQKLRESEKNEMKRKLRESQNSFADAEKNLVARSEFLEKENTRLESEMEAVLKELNSQKNHNGLMHNEVAQLEISLKQSQQQQLETCTYQKVLADTTQMYEKKIAELMKQLEIEGSRSKTLEEELNASKKLLSDHQESMQMENSAYQKALADTTQMYEKKVAELIRQLDDTHVHLVDIKEQLDSAKKLLNDRHDSIQIQEQKEIKELGLRVRELNQVHEASLKELELLRKEYNDLLFKKETLDDELHSVKKKLLAEEKQRQAIENELLNMKKLVHENEDGFEVGTPLGTHKSNQSRETVSTNRNAIARICEEVGLQKIIALLASEDLDVQIHAVKVVANLAAEDANQEKIVEEGGLDALLMMLQTSQNTTILRVASGAIANLAMNDLNQGLIVSKGGARLLANTALKTDDPQTLRMIAGAIANLCGNEKLHLMLGEDGGIKVLIGMVKCGNHDVIAQVARGIANFAKCESRGIIQGKRRGRSLMMEDGALTWLIANSNAASTSTRRHIELALCHLAQNEDNAQDFISSGGVKELVRISVESSREDIRNLAKKTLKLSPTFQADMYLQ